MPNPASHNLSPLATDVAHTLLRLGAVQLNVTEPFTWASGLRSPIYCDNRKLNSDVEARNQVLGAFVGMIWDVFQGHRGIDLIAGVATGGIPMGALIADRLALPFVYVRQEPKSHGLMRQVEGEWKPGARAVLIEDLVSTGGSSLKAVNGLREAGIQLMGLVSIMTYGFAQAEQAFAAHQVPAYSLCDIDAVLAAALTEGRITPQEAGTVRAFRASPSTWFQAGS